MQQDENNFYATHQAPAWHEYANFLIFVKIDENVNVKRWEQLWCKQIGDKKFQICCIPFFSYEMDLGDEVETNEDHIFIRVVKRSGYKTHRIWFGDSFETNIEEIVDSLKRIGAELEWSSKNLLAVSVSTANINNEVLKYLSPLHDQGKLIYESVTREVLSVQ
ncbi:DUF4265 domain-containing protein [Undibacterium sp. Di27W]|uniref:DUF4265 domain-containing protein n=1 Tax=Undibacterium sp. Di27W TaxID=3413036 RepID=UPI003BEF9A79